jgi:hypothetical protein
MPLNKRVGVELMTDSWSAPALPPPSLVNAAQATPTAINILCALCFTALWTRPPVRYGFSLSDCWAWLRYFPAIAATQDLRLCDAWTTLDPHQKTVLSGDFGVGFTTWFLYETLGFVKYSDTLWVVNTLAPGAFRLASSARRGPQKSPDYIAEDSGGNLSVLECKGTQSSRASLIAALGRGMPQKANLQAIGGTTLQHSLVAGLFIPQFDNSETAVIIVADPEWDELKERLSRFSKEEIRRSVSQVAYAKELATLEFPHAANTLVRAPGSDETIWRAIERDLAWERAPSRIATANAIGVERDYMWSEPLKLATGQTVSGIRFRGTLPRASVERLMKRDSPAAIGEEMRDESLRRRWTVEHTEESATLQSPLGTTFSLTLLEE